MEISSTNNGAATYALKKSLEMPNLLLSMLRNSTINQENAFLEKGPVSEPVDVSKETAKGGTIDIMV